MASNREIGDQILRLVHLAGQEELLKITTGQNTFTWEIAMRMRQNESFPNITDELMADLTTVNDALMQSERKKQRTEQQPWRTGKGKSKGKGKGKWSKSSPSWSSQRQAPWPTTFPPQPPAYSPHRLPHPHGRPTTSRHGQRHTHHSSGAVHRPRATPREVKHTRAASRHFRDSTAQGPALEPTQPLR